MKKIPSTLQIFEKIQESLDIWNEVKFRDFRSITVGSFVIDDTKKTVNTEIVNH